MALLEIVGGKECIGVSLQLSLLQKLSLPCLGGRRGSFVDRPRNRHGHRQTWGGRAGGPVNRPKNRQLPLPISGGLWGGRQWTAQLLQFVLSGALFHVVVCVVLICCDDL